MKIIDEKGKLFGKLNVIDLLVIILAIAAVVVIGSRLFGEQVGTIMNSTTSIRYTALVTGINPEMCEELEKYVDQDAGLKDQLMADGELVNGYVVDFYTVPHVNYYSDDEGVITTSIEQGENARVDVYFVIEAEVTDPIVNKVGTQEVRTGKSHIVKTTHFEFSYAQIMSCDIVE